MRKLDYSSYKIVAPLSSVYLAVPSPSELWTGGYNLDISLLLDLHAAASLKASPPKFTQDRELADPCLERLDPIAKQRRETWVARRLRKQLFPGARTAEAMLPTLEGLLNRLHTVSNDESRNRCASFYTEFNKFNKKYLITQPPGDIWENPAEFIEFAYPLSSAEYVKEYYCTPLFSATEDPDGSRQRTEESLYRHTLPHWEWQRHDGEWLALQATESTRVESEFAQHILMLFMTRQQGGLIRLRTKAVDVEDYLSNYTWETEVLKRMGWSPSRNELQRLYRLTDNLTSQVVRKISEDRNDVDTS